MCLKEMCSTRSALLAIITLACSAFIPSPVRGAEKLEKQMLEHVEKIIVVDSINVDRNAFFKHYQLRPSAGRILAGKDVSSLLAGVTFPKDFASRPLTGFTNEFNDYLVWTQQDSVGNLRLAESYRLIDGTWSTPNFASLILNAGEEVEEDDIVSSDAVFPFMNDDGQTLYFAADNENSLGGFDIFVATKDPSDGSFFIPRNLGMPFNSPYDDYMLAIDNQTGVGWWATDRNQLENEITIYVFALPERRVNVDPTDENLLRYATLSGWESLLDEEGQSIRNKFLGEIAAINLSEEPAYDFYLSFPQGKAYRYFSDFKSQKSVTLMQRYLREKAALEEEESKLANLREKYYLSAGDKKIGAEIQQLETRLRTARNTLRILLSDIYSAEGVK